MPNHHVCATLSSLNIGAKVGLAKCDKTISLTDTEKLKPETAPNLCITTGKETRFGRGGTSQHQIKALTLKACDETATAYQTWRIRTFDDDQ